jgi:uncharacterized protein YjiK
MHAARTKGEMKMLFILPRFLFFISLVFAGCAGDQKSKAASEVKEKKYETGYNMRKPDKRFILPDTLHEISGLTNIDANTFACVQDENGIVFIYDVTNNKIEKQFTFNIDGDYEGITRVGKTIYILRSDGVLFEISDYQSANFKLTSYETGIPANNNEGLCYDADNNRLLIACKSKIGKGKEYKDKRAIYGFDLVSKTLSDEPAFEFDVQVISAFAVDKDIEIAAKENKKGRKKAPAIKFRTSAIAIHPVSKKLYLLSASDHMLFIFDMQGKLEHIEQLDEEMFNKAEGITFFDNGDMLITNEGQDKKPTLLWFDYTMK